MTIKTDKVVVGLNATDTNNFLIDTDGAGALRIRSKSDGSGTTILNANGTALTGLPGLTITTSQTTPLPGVATLLSYTHGLGVVPVWADVEVVCLTAELGYSIGDVLPPLTFPTNALCTPMQVNRTSTVVETRTGANIGFVLLNKTTGVPATLTAANWAWRFKLRVA